MVKCDDCKYWSWDWYDDGEEFECCLYCFFTHTDIYPTLQDSYPYDEYVDWDCKYFVRDGELI